MEYLTSFLDGLHQVVVGLLEFGVVLLALFIIARGIGSGMRKR